MCDTINKVEWVISIVIQAIYHIRQNHTICMYIHNSRYRAVINVKKKKKPDE